MKTLELLLRMIILLPVIILKNLMHSRRQKSVNAQEAERLDRIRKPWKYRGK